MKLFVILIIFVLKTILAEEVPVFIEDLTGVESRIVNGEFAKPGQFPWQAHVQLTISAINTSCGGALICDSWILTAARCVKGASGFNVYLGSVNQSQSVEAGRVTVTAKRALFHNEFNENLRHHDIGLIQLNKKITYTNKIQAIPLNSGRLGANILVTVSGWGASKSYGPVSPRLKFVNLYTISHEGCNSQYYGVSNQTLCCIGQNKQNACTGDSGGPLVMKKKDGKFIHVGVTSYVSGRGCEVGEPAAYVRTESYTAWIKKQIGNTCQLPKA